MLKTELFTEVTVETLLMLSEAGITVEINDGQITDVNF